jgi:hypothetical protein
LTHLTWKDVIARTNLIGGDIETQEDSVVFRGPIIEIKEEGDMIIFSSPWSARLNPQTGEWENWKNIPLSVNKMFVPQDIGGGRIFFTLPFLGVCTLFPCGTSKLDPKKVKDLNL